MFKHDSKKKKTYLEVLQVQEGLHTLLHLAPVLPCPLSLLVTHRARVYPEARLILGTLFLLELRGLLAPLERKG